ncbi:hypothetical protein KI387_002067, partial [Taxus chinensis]
LPGNLIRLNMMNWSNIENTDMPFQCGRRSKFGRTAKEINGRATASAFEFESKRLSSLQWQSSSFASTSGVNKLSYDLFINYRGSNVNHKLASAIYHTLDLMGFRALFNAQQLKPGDEISAEIQRAIANSSIHIAIFPPTCAQSPVVFE